MLSLLKAFERNLSDDCHPVFVIVGLNELPIHLQMEFHKFHFSRKGTNSDKSLRIRYIYTSTEDIQPFCSEDQACQAKLIKLKEVKRRVYLVSGWKNVLRYLF